VLLLLLQELLVLQGAELRRELERVEADLAAAQAEAAHGNHRVSHLAVTSWSSATCQQRSRMSHHLVIGTAINGTPSVYR
jgi:hypothetical protein